VGFGSPRSGCGVVRPRSGLVGMGPVWLIFLERGKHPKMAASAKKVQMIGNASNDAASIIATDQPYRILAKIHGVAPYLFHRWSVDAVEAKSKAAKGSKAKKEDDLESYVYRDKSGVLCIPAEQFRMSIVLAAKFKQDPRSPRKSAMDLFKAATFPTEEYCSTGKKDWDYIDRRRVMVQRNGITRHRPALLAGWEVDVQLEVVLPEYVHPELLNEILQLAGRINGVGDFRPTFGRFQVTNFKVL
jgi:hypothetical protein